MANIPGFDILELLFQNELMNIYRAGDRTNRRMAMIKVPRHQSANTLVTREYDLASGLDPRQVIKPTALETHEQLKFLVYDDFNARPLRSILPADLGLEDQLILLANLSGSLAHIHQNSILHNYVNPDTLWVDPENLNVKITGFEHALPSRTDSGKSHIHSLESSETHLAYMAPEQTGRTSLDLSMASDLYSLGCTFYEIMTGRVPFSTDDTLELIHSHLAKDPVPPHQTRPEIPEFMSAIIMKMMKKRPEDRYTSCDVLKKDVELCKSVLNDPVSQVSFIPGEHDPIQSIDFSEQIYGRETDTRRLMDTLTDTTRDPTPLIMISGPPGIGKTEFVKHVGRRLNHRVYFAIGKHDKIPTRNVVQSVFESLILQIISEGKPAMSKWKEQIHTVLGNNLRIMTDMVPMLEFIVGKQPPLINLSPIENEIRINITMRKFIETLADREKPLVMFLDDLQWAEPESIRLIEIIGMSPIDGFYIICAFRDSQVTEDHVFIRTVDQLRHSGMKIHEIALSPISEAQQKNWLKDLFSASGQAPEKNLETFSVLLYEKTGGNPFYLKSFLDYLLEKQLILSTSNRSWHWDLEKINTVPATNTPDNFLSRKTAHLDTSSKTLLNLAACTGSSIPSPILEKLYAQTSLEFQSALAPILTNGIMELDKDNLRFMHDIIMESASELIPEDERLQLHLKIGRQLLAITPENELEDRCLLIADQLNAASSLILDPNERVTLAGINLKAGQKKMKLASLQSAEQYFRTGIELMGSDGWRTDFNLTMGLHIRQCEILFIMGEQASAQTVYDRALSHSRHPDEMLAILEAKSAYLMQAYQAGEVVESALAILKRLEFQLPGRFNLFYLIREILGFRLALIKTPIDQIDDLPEITDARQSAIIRIMIIISRACALNGNPLAIVVMFRALRFICQKGINPYAGYVFSYYAHILSNLKYRLEKGYKFARLAVDTIDRFKEEKQKILPEYLFILISINSHGKTRHHLNQISMILKQSLRAGIFMNVFNLHVMYFFLHFISGTKLSEIEQDMAARRNDILGAKQAIWNQNLDLLFQVIRILRGKDNVPFLTPSPTDIYDEQLVATWQKTYSIATVSDFFLYRQIIAYLHDDHTRSLIYAEKGRPYFNSYVTLTAQMTHRFFHALALALAHRMKPGSSPGPAVLFKTFKDQLGFFKKIYRQAPENNPHMYYLLQAKYNQFKNRFQKASRLYHLAIQAARTAGYIHVEAICCEQAARFFLEQKQPYFAIFLIQESIGLFEEWGCTPKSKLLKEEFDALLKESLPPKTSAAGSSAFRDPDVLSVLRASQAISREVQPRKLMKQLISLIIRNSGAQRAFLLLHTDDHLRIQASAQTDPEEIEVLQDSIVAQTSDLLPASTVHYVFMSQKRIILEHASRSGMFNHDPYMLKNRPISVLCIPVVGKKRTKGVLYLENNLISGAFTEERVSTLNILINQMVISIDNSTLYEDLKNEIRKQVHATRKIKEHQVQLQKMSSQLAEVEEQERKAIADDLHDSVTQTLAMSISMFKTMKIPEHVQNARITLDLLEQSLTNIRSLTFQLSSPLLYDVGLEAALEWLCEDVSTKNDIHIEFKNFITPTLTLNDTQKVSLYRMSRELIINIIKHARADKASMTLSLNQGRLTVCVKDNGMGFDRSRVSKGDGFGLFSISERINILEGDMEIDSVKGEGSAIYLRVPVNHTTD